MKICNGILNLKKFENIWKCESSLEWNSQLFQTRGFHRCVLLFLSLFSFSHATNSPWFPHLCPPSMTVLSLHRLSHLQKQKTCTTNTELQVHRLSMGPPKFLFFSGGTALNAIAPIFRTFTDSVYVLPISDNGGSSSVIMDVIGGPSIGDIFF